MRVKKKEAIDIFTKILQHAQQLPDADLDYQLLVSRATKNKIDEYIKALGEPEKKICLTKTPKSHLRKMIP